MLILFLILLVLALILLTIVKYEIHPFLALFGGALLFGLLAGMDAELILLSISEGFGGVLGSVGLLIILGVILGTFLEKTGGAIVLAERILNWTGKKAINLTMMLGGYFLSIPVFGDSTIIMMNPIAKSLALKTSRSYAGTMIALSLGAMCSHSLVPPTPGPIATAGILGADLGQLIFFGIIVSLLTLIPGYIFVNVSVSKIPLVAKLSTSEEKLNRIKFPSALKSFLPIVIPLMLIILASIANYPSHPLGTGKWIIALEFLGAPVIALFIGVLLSFTLPKKLDKKMLSATGWVGEALLIAAPVIFITGAGAVFGKMLQNSGIGALVSQGMKDANWGIFLPFVIAFALKTAQGSTTVAMITAASIIAPLLTPLGLDSETMKVLTALSCGAGAMAISHANDSGFWVVTQLSGMSIKQGNQSHSLGTLIMSSAAMLIIYGMSWIVT